MVTGRREWHGATPPYVVETFEYRGAQCIVTKPHQWRKKYANDSDPYMRMLADQAESHNGYVVAYMPGLDGRGSAHGYDYATEKVSVHGGWTLCDAVSAAPKTILGFDGQHKEIITQERAVAELKQAVDGLIEAEIMEATP